MWNVILSCLLLYTCNAAGLIERNYAGRPCIGEMITLTCTVPGVGLNWAFDGCRHLSVSVTATENSTPDGRALQDNTTNSTHFVSTLFTTAVDGQTIGCKGIGVSVGPIIVMTAGLPSIPKNLSHSILNGSLDGVNVSICWDPLSNNGGRDDLNYTVSIAPPAQLSTAVATSVTVTDADYNVDYIVSVVATNCAGNSSIAQYSFRFSPCDVPPPPPANGSIVDSVTGPFPVGTVIYYKCDSGFSPTGNMSSICSSYGMWDPNPQDQMCSGTTADCSCLGVHPSFTVLCSLPDPPKNGFVVQISNTTVVFGCNEGFAPQKNRSANCVGVNQWSSEPTEIMCIALLATDTPASALSTGAAIGVTLAVSAVVFSVIGCLAGVVVTYLTLSHMKSVRTCQVEGQANVHPAVPAQAAGPVYDDVLPAPKEEIELRTNEAYGPVAL